MGTIKKLANFIILPEHIDTYNHLNNAHYAHYFLKAEIPSKANTYKSNYQFKIQIKPKEKITIETILDELENGFVINQKMYNSQGKLAATAEKYKTQNISSENIERDTIYPQLFEIGRQELQFKDGIEDSELMKNNLGMIVTSADYDHKFINEMNGKSTLHSEFDYQKGMKVHLLQKLIHESGQKIAECHSQHVFVEFDNKGNIKPIRPLPYAIERIQNNLPNKIDILF